MSSRVEIHSILPYKVLLHVKPANFGLKLMLLLILIPCLLLPLISTYAVLTYYGAHIGILAIYVLFWGPGLFIFRSLLWNSLGKEVLEIHSTELAYHADFKYFKDGKQNIPVAGLKVKVQKTNHKTNMGLLELENKGEKMNTVIEIPMEELHTVKQFIETSTQGKNTSEISSDLQMDQS